jgi:hypothetical protein
MADIARIQTLLAEASQNPERAASLAREALASLRSYGGAATFLELGVDGLVRVDGPVIAGPAAGQMTEAPPIYVMWPSQAGIVRFIFAGVLAGEEAAWRVSARIELPDGAHLFSNGEQADFAPFAAMGLHQRPLRVNDIPVSNNNKWKITFRNEDSTTASHKPWLILGWCKRRG